MKVEQNFSANIVPITMARLNLQERIFLVDTMKETKSRQETWRLFRKKYGRKLSLNTITAMVQKWKTEGSVHDRHKGNSGRKRSARTPENAEKLNSLIESNPKMSVRRLSFASCMKKSSVQTILRKDLRLKPYKPQISQELKEGDDIKRLAFCRKIERMIRNDELEPGNILFTDESHIYLRGSPNKQNNREWRVSKPDNRTSLPLHSPKVTVWCGLNSTKVIGPYFYEDPDTEAPLTVTKERYTQMLMTIFPEDSEEVNGRCIFMQDGAPAHTSRMAMECLEEKFPGRLISNKSDFVWPPRSPDLNPCDFFLWGYMKEEIHRAQPASTTEVKQLIREFMLGLTEDLLRRVTEQFISRVRKCIEVRGGVFE